MNLFDREKDLDRTNHQHLKQLEHQKPATVLAELHLEHNSEIQPLPYHAG